MTVHLPGVTPPEGANLAIRIELTARANITPFVAAQKVSRFVVTEISTALRTDTPELIVGERLCWSVPVVLTSPARGVVGKVGDVRVDASTGELLIDADTIGRMTEDARALRFNSRAVV